MSVLQKPEVKAAFNAHYLGVHSDFGELQLDDADPRHATVARFNPSKLRPVLVFLDAASGKEVVRHVGRLNDAGEALALDRYVTERLYRHVDYAKYRAARGSQ